MATQTQINDFIKLIAQPVIDQCKKHGWGIPSAIIAQAGLESAWGTSGLAKTCFNFWGMKWKDGCGCGYKEYKTSEQKTSGEYYTVIARFRKFDSVADGIDGYAKFIESYKRYVPVMNAKDYKEYANQLKACGWATSINYAKNIINTVEKYNLIKYDGEYVKTYPTIRRGSKGEYVIIAQEILNKKGYDCGKVDGIFGPKTALQVNLYQSDNGLDADSIIGPKTWKCLLS